jgi:predicted esterase
MERFPRFGRSVLGLGCALALGSGCREGKRLTPASGPPSAAIVASAGAANARPEPPAPPALPRSSLPALRANWLEPLDLGDGDAAVVSPPLGATERRPLVVAVHGAHDRPEWACGGWRLGFAQYPFVVCPRGTPVTRDKYAWSNSAAIARVTLKAIARVRERYGEHVAGEPHVFAAFSQGATLAEPFLIEHAALFPTVILAEGGYATLDSKRFAQSFVERGGKTVVIVCGTAGCRQRTAPARRRLESAGLRVFESGDPRSGHNLNQLMQEALRRDFSSWFVEDPAWSSARGDGVQSGSAGGGAASDGK